MGFRYTCRTMTQQLWVNDQLDTQLRYIRRLLLSSTCFEQHCAHHREVELY